MNIPGLTEDEKLLISGGLSMVGGAVVGVGQGTYQYLTTPGGHVTFGSAVSFAVAGFLTLMGVALRAYVPAHAQQMLADAEARATQLEEALHLATTTQPIVVPSIPQAPVAAPASPVTIHFNGVPIVNPPTTGTAITDLTTAVQNSSIPILPLAHPILASVSQSVNSASSLPAITPAPVQLTMAPAAPTIASTPDLASEDTAVRKSVTIVS